MGFDDPAAWRSDRDYQGATLGRYANRIKSGSFQLDGTAYQVPVNEGTTALHGGQWGFDSCEWELEPVRESADQASVTLHRTSPDGEMGFPGNLQVSVLFSVSGTDLTIDYRATTDAPTPVNLSNHVYLNLTGTSTSVADHVLTLFADDFATMGAGLIMTGELTAVADTPFDFNTPVAIGDRWRSADPQMLIGRGYDQAYVLSGSAGGFDGLTLAAVVLEPRSGRSLQLFTDQPAVQFYTGNSLNGSSVTRAGQTLRQGDAFCLEPEQLPDSINNPQFPDTILRPGTEYRNRTVYRFSAG